MSSAFKHHSLFPPLRRRGRKTTLGVDSLGRASDLTDCADTSIPETQHPTRREEGMKDTPKVMEVVLPVCCGVDIHKETAVCCLMTTQAKEVKKEIRTFSTMTH